MAALQPGLGALGAPRRPAATCKPNGRGRTRAVNSVLPELAATLHTVVDGLAAAAPAPLGDMVEVVGGDIANVAAMQPTLEGVARLSVRCVDVDGMARVARARRTGLVPARSGGRAGRRGHSNTL
jgi:hypothetical protein